MGARGEGETRIHRVPSPGSAQAAVLTRDSDGVASLRLESLSCRPRPFSLECLHHLESCLDEVEAGVARGEVVALVVRVGSPPNVSSDIDLEEIRSLPDTAAARAWAGEGQRILHRIERLPVPAVAAIVGRCTWGGLQVALACHHRLALGAPATRLGVPEVRLGILPAWGGTVRLMRRVGVQSALDLILRGDTVSAARAESMGLVDGVFSRRRFEERVRRFTLRRVKRRRDDPASRRGIATRVLEDTAPGRRLVFARATRRARKAGSMHGVILDAVLRSAADILALSLEGAFAAEAERFAELFADDVPRSLINHQLLLHPTSSPCARKAGREVRRTAVIGAGRLGIDLTQALAGRGFTVRLKDTRRETVARAIRQIRDRLGREAGEERLDERELERSLRRIRGTTGFGGFGRIDVVIEVVADHPEAVRRALREVEDHVRDGCTLLTTSPLVSVSEVQRGLTRPEQMAGLHLLRSGGRPAVAEVVRGEQTADTAIDAACALARRLAGVTVVVADSPGLVTYRLIVPYLNEALRLQGEGFTAEQIDGTMVRFGISVGPLRLLREIGSGTFERVAADLSMRLEDRFAPWPYVARSTRASRARRALGGLRGLAGLRVGAPGRNGSADATSPEADAIRQRLTLILINEAALVLSEGIVPAASEIDRVVTAVFGFPAERGGLLFHADRIGAATIVEMLQSLAARQGTRFAPAALLLRLAAERACFYDREPAARAAAGQVAVEVLT